VRISEYGHCTKYQTRSRLFSKRDVKNECPHLTQITVILTHTTVFFLYFKIEKNLFKPRLVHTVDVQHNAGTAHIICINSKYYMTYQKLKHVFENYLFQFSDVPGTR